MAPADIERLSLSADGNRRVSETRITASLIRELALDCGFDLAGVAPASPAPDFDRFRDWVDRGQAGEMGYLTDHRADVRGDLEKLLPGVRSVICTGTLYNGPEPHSTDVDEPARGWISRYAWSEDYHQKIRPKLEQIAGKLYEIKPHVWRSAVDTLPLLERSFARHAGLGWIGKNTCLINQEKGSWFFLGEILTTLEIEPDGPPPDRCGTCTRCIDACPTQAIIPSPQGGWELEAKACISYFTIELRTSIPAQYRTSVGNHVFGCDICQDVCPWNRRATTDADPALDGMFAPDLASLSEMSSSQFNRKFRKTPVSRSGYSGFLRNVATAMGNSGDLRHVPHLERLSASQDSIISEHARWALENLKRER